MKSKLLDFEKVKAFYKLGKQLSFEDIKVLLNEAKSKSIQANEIIIDEGSSLNNIFYIYKGLMRSYHINERGDEITVALYAENQIVASPNNILFDKPARFYFQTLEDSNVLTMNYDVLQEIVEGDPKLEQNRKYILQKIIGELSQRVESFVLHSPEERYIRYVRENPEIINRVPDKYIANVLGITPVSLSRIRKRISTKK